MSRIKLFDSFVLDGVHRSESGYLAAHAKVARTGIQVYQGCEVGQPDKEKITLYRPPEEVFHVDAMHSMAHRPVTLTHPPVMVDSKNWKKYAKGQTGDEIVRDGDSVRVPVTLMDQATIDAYESGDACEMSMGYTTDIDWTAGTTPQGESYDGVQRNIRANHLAFVPQARGGEKLRFGDEDRDDHGRWSSGGGGQGGDDDEEAAKKIMAKALAAKAAREATRDPKTGWLPGSGAEKLRRSAKDAAATCAACAASMTMKGDEYVCDGCGGTKKYGDWVPVGDTAFTAEERRDLAKKGQAKPDGSYPIRNREDLGHAIAAYGRGGATESDKAWIKKRAKALGAESDLPDDWKQSTTTDGDVLHSTHRKYIMPITAAFDGVTVEFADELSASNMNTAFSSLKAKLKDAEKKSEKDDEDMDEKDKKNKADCDDAKAKIDAKDGEIAVLKKQLADAAVTPAALDAMLRDREVIKDSAKKVLGATFAFDGKSIAEIKHAAVVAKLGDAVVKDMNEAAVSGAFVALTAAAGTGGTNRLADALGSHARNTVIAGDSRSDGVRLRDEAHALMVDRMRNPKAYDKDGRKIA